MVPQPDKVTVKAAAAKVANVKRLIVLRVGMMTPKVLTNNKKRGNIIMLPPAGNFRAARLLSLERQQIKRKILNAKLSSAVSVQVAQTANLVMICLRALCLTLNNYFGLHR